LDFKFNQAGYCQSIRAISFTFDRSPIFVPVQSIFKNTTFLESRIFCTGAITGEINSLAVGTSYSAGYSRGGAVEARTTK
jgi:hypothetical protein